MREARLMCWIETLVRDLRHGARLLFRQPVLALLAVFTLSLGISANATIFSLLNAAILQPLPFPDPDRLDIARADNRHVAFGWAGHFCFGAPLARIEGQVAFEKLIRRFDGLRLQPGPINWRHNLGLRGLTALPISL